jgi:hypothetical protein
LAGLLDAHPTLHDRPCRELEKVHRGRG